MTDKERLEEAKLMAEMLRVETRLPHDFPFDLVDWLIEQAERVQELENHNKNYRKAIKGCIERMNEGGAGTRSFVYEKLTKALEGEE